MGPFLTHIKFAAAGANNQQKQAKKPFIRIYKAIVKAKLGQNFCLILECIYWTLGAWDTDIFNKLKFPRFSLNRSYEV